MDGAAAVGAPEPAELEEAAARARARRIRRGRPRCRSSRSLRAGGRQPVVDVTPRRGQPLVTVSVQAMAAVAADDRAVGVSARSSARRPGDRRGGRDTSGRSATRGHGALAQRRHEGCGRRARERLDEPADVRAGQAGGAVAALDRDGRQPGVDTSPLPAEASPAVNGESPPGRASAIRRSGECGEGTFRKKVSASGCRRCLTLVLSAAAAPD